MADRNLEFRPQPPPRPEEPATPSDVAADAHVIWLALSEAMVDLMEARQSLEKARDLAVNHSVVPAETRAAVDAAYERLLHDATVVADAANTVARVLDFRLGTNHVCPKCGAGTVDPDARPWHYVGCPFAEAE
jgi:hypothetical protein